MSQMVVWYDEDAETWFLADSTTDRVILELRRGGEYDDPADPWRPENPCVLRSLHEDEVLTIDSTQKVALVVEGDDVTP